MSMKYLRNTHVLIISNKFLLNTFYYDKNQRKPAAIKLLETIRIKFNDTYI